MATYTGSDKRLAYLFEHGGGGGGSANIWTGTMAEYIAQASQIADDTAVFITDDETQSLIVSSYDIYSTDEKEVGVWTDGKPLYQKTVYIASVTSGTSYAHGAENVENIFIKNIKAKRNVGWFSSGHIFQDGTGYISESFSIIPSPTVLYAYLYGNTISDCSVTIQYTKTTDTAGSGLFVPSGVVAHHYSTTEQVVGTWVDGKPLYEKTIDTSLSVSTGGSANITQLSNIDHLFMTEASFEESGIIYMLNEMSTRVMFNKNTGYLSLKAASGASWYGQIKITIRYTKTTD